MIMNKISPSDTGSKHVLLGLFYHADAGLSSTFIAVPTPILRRANHAACVLQSLPIYHNGPFPKLTPLCGGLCVGVISTVISCRKRHIPRRPRNWRSRSRNLLKNYVPMRPAGLKRNEVIIEGVLASQLYCLCVRNLSKKQARK